MGALGKKAEMGGSAYEGEKSLLAYRRTLGDLWARANPPLLSLHLGKPTNCYIPSKFEFYPSLLSAIFFFNKCMFANNFTLGIGNRR